MGSSSSSSPGHLPDYELFKKEHDQLLQDSQCSTYPLPALLRAIFDYQTDFRRSKYAAWQDHFDLLVEKNCYHCSRSQRQSDYVVNTHAKLLGSISSDTRNKYPVLYASSWHIVKLAAEREVICDKWRTEDGGAHDAATVTSDGTIVSEIRYPSRVHGDH